MNVFFKPLHDFSLSEICHNSLDDDNDGLIDLNDPDCSCNGIPDSVLVISSIIPNASFENYTSCPDNFSQMDLCEGWIQASPATSDYFNKCGFSGNDFIGYPPLPLPSGNGYVGFLDVSRIANNQTEAYKEYIGTCLNKPLIAKKEYTLSFWVGFGTGGSQAKSRSTFYLSIFGTDSCKNLPFLDLNNVFGCPRGLNGWYSMSQQTITGTNEWKKVVVKINFGIEINAIVIGPSCPITDGWYYYWLDELLLQESSAFDTLKVLAKTNICSEDSIILSTSKSLTTEFEYQWYKDGIAILGADQPRYAFTNEMSGTYQVRVSLRNHYELSKPYIHQYIPNSITRVDTSICKGSLLKIANKEYANSGIYYDTLRNINGCDSLLEIKLSQRPIYNDTIKFEICKNSKFVFDGKELDSTGIYPFSYSSFQNCDSVMVLDLKIKKTDISEINRSICEGDKIKIANKIYDHQGNYLDTLVNINGCDSILKIEILENNVFNQSLSKSICDGEYFEVGSKKYYESGRYIDTLKTSLLCDSIIQLDLLVNKVHHTTIDTNICKGEYLDVFGIKYFNSGGYKLIGQNQFSCDSIINLNLIVNNNDTIRIDTSICEGNSIEILKQKYSQSTNKIIQTINQFQCDSSIALKLLVNPVYQYLRKESICDGTWIEIGNQKFDKSGMYTISLKTDANCDSTIFLELVSFPHSSYKLDTAICFNDSLKIGHKSLSQSGDYHFLEKNQFACDSFIHIKLLVNSDIRSIDSVKQLDCELDHNAEIIPTIIGGSAPYKYMWNTGSQNEKLLGLSHGNYSVTVTDQFNCQFIQNYQIDTISCFCFDIDHMNGSCLSGGQGFLNIKQTSGRKPIEYLLNGIPVNLDGTGSIQLKTGTYVLEILDEENCKFSQLINLELEDNFEQEIGLDTLYFNVGDSVELKFNLPNYLKFRQGIWTGSNSIACPTCLETKSIAKNGESEYIFEGEDVNSCPFIYRLIVNGKQGFYVPNIFSPNNDQNNDYFNLISDTSVELIDLLQIYDRWGEKLFESKSGLPNSSTGAWDGTKNGRLINPGVYVYYIKFKDKLGTSHQLTGDLTLIR